MDVSMVPGRGPRAARGRRRASGWPRTVARGTLPGGLLQRGAPRSCPPASRGGEAPRGRAGPAAATRACGAALAIAAAGTVSRAAARGLLGVEQHLRSHACVLKRSSPNCAPSDVSASRLPGPPPGPTSFPPAAPSLLRRVRGGRRLAARGAGEFLVLALCLGGRIPDLAPREEQPPPHTSNPASWRPKAEGTRFRGTQTDPRGLKDAARSLQVHFKWMACLKKRLIQSRKIVTLSGQGGRRPQANDRWLFNSYTALSGSLSPYSQSVKLIFK